MDHKQGQEAQAIDSKENDFNREYWGVQNTVPEFVIRFRL